MAKVTMPQLGESVAEGTIGKWLKKPGDPVAKYEPLLEVITDKVNAEVPSPFEGTLKEILVEEGATVPNNAEIAVIEEAGGAVAAAGTPSPGAGGIAGEPEAQPSEPEPAPPAEALPHAAEQPGYGPAGSDERPVQEGRDGAAAAAQPVSGGRTATAARAAAEPVPVMEDQGNAEARMTPAVRRLLREHDLRPEQISGTGHGGRITREDVMNFVERQRTGGVSTPAAAMTAATPQPAAAPAAPAREAGPSPAAQSAPAQAGATAAAQAPAGPSSPSPAPGAPSFAAVAPPSSWAPGQDEELVPLNQMRRGIANQMAKANAVPVAYSTFECDMTPIARLRDRVKDEYRAREGIGLSFLPFVVKAVVEALKRSPDLNAHYSEEGLVRKRRINIGIAVAVDNGLIVPVVHDADQLSVNGLNRAIQDLASRARANKLRLDDLQGSTFTVDNTGWFGSIVSSPIINTPEVCILTTEAVVKRPIVKETDDGDVIVIRSMMNLCAGFDHRATDGAQIGRFVNDVIRWLQSAGPDLPIY